MTRDIEHERMREDVNREVLQENAGLRRYSDFNLRDVVAVSRRMVDNFYNYAFKGGGMASLFGSSEDMQNKHGVGQGQDVTTENAATAFCKSSSLAVPDFGSAQPAAAAAQQTTPAAGGSTFEVKMDDDDDKEKVTGKDKKALMAKLTGEGGYNDDEAAAIIAAVEKKAGGDRAGMGAMLSDPGFPKQGEENWHQKFASWYARRIGGKSNTQAAEFVKENVGTGDTKVSLKRDKSYGGSNKGAKVLKDCPEFGLEAGDKIAYDGSNWYKGVDVVEGLNVPPSTEEDKKDFTLTVEGETKPGAKACEDATSFMEYMNPKLGVSSTAAAAVEPDTPKAKLEKVVNDALTAESLDGSLKATCSDDGKSVELNPANDGVKPFLAATFKDDTTKDANNAQIKALADKLEAAGVTELTFMGEKIDLSDENYHAQIQKILKDKEIITV